MGDVSVTITGVLADLIKPIGCTLIYPRSSIPSAIVQVDASNSTILDNFESHRHDFAEITITSPSGKITFNGFLDGLSFNQTPGSFSYEAIFKSRFQDLQYVYPRMLGVSIGQAPFTRRPLIFVRPLGQAGATENVIAQDFIVQDKILLELPTSKNLIDSYLRAILAIVEAWTSSNLADPTYVVSPLLNLLKKPDYQGTLSRAKNLLANIDTTAVKDMIVTGTQWSNIMHKMLNEGLFLDAENLWELMVSGLSRFGCTYIMGTSKIYVIPENTFLRTNIGGDPGFREESSLVNVAYPAQYTTLNFNDNGFRDIRYCVLMAGLGDSSATPAFRPMHIDIATYEDTNSRSTGFAIESANYFLNALSTGTITAVTPKAIEDAKSRGGNVTKIIPEGTNIAQIKKAEEELEKINKTYQDKIAAYGDIFKQFAQIKYLQRKYADRTGSIHMPLNFNWVPGTSGMVVSRYPGITIDFYVDVVQHRVSLTAPNNGDGSTTISFSAGRLSKKGSNDASVGLTSDGFYNYTVEKMQAIQNSFIADLAGGGK